MRWRGWLGSSVLRDWFLTPCNLSFCSCCFGFYSAPFLLLRSLSPCSCRFGFYSVPSFPMFVAGIRSCGCCRCGVPWRGFVFLLLSAIASRLRASGVSSLVVAFHLVLAASASSSLRPSKSSPRLSLGFEPNAPAHRERPTRGLSV